MAGQAALQPDLDAFPAGPQSAVSMAGDQDGLLKQSGESQLTSADGL